jgi:hypothetical protein
MISFATPDFRSHLMKRLFAAALLLGVSACSSLPTGPTGPGPGPGSGYSEEMVSPNRYRITYTAPPETKAALVADRTLARAAQLTLDKGSEWFEIASKIDGAHTQTLVIVMGKGESLAGGPKQYDAKETLAKLKSKLTS